MTLKEYKESLDKLVEQHPEYLELDVVAASDDEGNDFNRVYYTASIIELDKNVICLN